jgi:prevent-host-death family protein
MQTVSVQDAETNLAHLLERVQQGEEILIVEAGMPIAKLVGISLPKRELGFLRSAGVIDPVELVASLDDETLLSWEQRER